MYDSVGPERGRLPPCCSRSLKPVAPRADLVHKHPEQTRLREAETHLEHLAITRKTVAGLANRLLASPPELPEHPGLPASSPNIEGTRTKLERLVELAMLPEIDIGNFVRKQYSAPRPALLPRASP
ncbi:hypothetical protein GCM10017668_00790 [Streptomyces tuirus]|uniref:Uncharacterized protein n=1 Tax=Streptomyces tuirus TaxID=68278 RepID=A0A7G1N8X8_9ACTN|nr:hypothetical protein GCM10017668_00790 [Streptomyces tuirus]